MLHKNTAVRRHIMLHFAGKCLLEEREIEILSPDFLCGPLIQFLDTPGLYKLQSEKKIKVSPNPNLNRNSNQFNHHPNSFSKLIRWWKTA